MRQEIDKSLIDSIKQKIIDKLYLKIADTTNPYFGAIVPCAGFYLSTQSINIVKKIWLKKRK